jgi:indoleamine 2,3-dioxygenase
MARYGVTSDRGFLPARDPLRRLPPAFAGWEELAVELPKLLTCGAVRRAIARLPELDARYLEGEEQFDRAMLLLSYFGHAYVFGDQPTETRIPRCVAVPWYAVAEKLGRPPVLSYASHALNNWRRLEKDGPIELGNMARLENFHGGMDEDWFVLVHVAIEGRAGRGIAALVEAQEHVRDDDPTRLTAALEVVAGTLRDMMGILKRMPSRCDPYIYYTRVRPFIFGWMDEGAFPDGMLYEGVTAYGGRGQRFRGETGAQSSIIPTVDAALGMDFTADRLGHHLAALRAYMPPCHRRFIADIAGRPGIRPYVLEHRDAGALVEAYNACVEGVRGFRETHLEYAGTYIHAQSQRVKSNPTEVGTGGTPFMQYLKQHCRDIDAFRVG